MYVKLLKHGLKEAQVYVTTLNNSAINLNPALTEFISLFYPERKCHG